MVYFGRNSSLAIDLRLRTEIHGTAGGVVCGGRPLQLWNGAGASATIGCNSLNETGVVLYNYGTAQGRPQQSDAIP